MVDWQKTMLDVGCGCHPVGAVNVDLLLENSDRSGVLDKRKIPNLIKADTCFLPIRSKAFSKVFCSHLLEHIQDENQVLRELGRVSCGVVEIWVPFKHWETMANCILFWTDRRQWTRENHVWHYTKKTLRMALEKCFKKEAIIIRYGYVSTRLSFKPHLHLTANRTSKVRFPIPFELCARVYLNGYDP